MIDVSPLLLWPVQDVLELMPFDTADNPQARRIAILVAEAHAAGQTGPVLATLCDWGRELSGLLHFGPAHASSRAALTGVLDAGDAIARHRTAQSSSAGDLPDELLQILEETSQGAADGPAEQAAVLLATYALALTDTPPVRLPAEDAWHVAAAMLCALAEASGDAADATIVRCAEVAYRVLFPSE